MELVVPETCLPFIRMQRSRYNAEKVPDGAEVMRRYTAHVLEDFAGMAPHLPEKVGSILEIGCGIGALAALLKKRYPEARLELLDADEVNSPTGGSGYSKKRELYNSRAETEALLAANGATVSRWHDIGATDLLEADLVVSLASWGYHYPLATYRVRSANVIADLRRSVEAQRGVVIFKGPKYDRCLFKLD
jgi:hypothetical protein